MALELLKFITCGSVDDGKSTLIGHMLYDAKLLFADQKQALMLDSMVGSNDGELDYSLLLDGLAAEREQGITIDVAYRYFTTQKRSFIVADCPGHEEYTRNMAVGASFADAAVILADASRGLTMQTMRHIRICSLMGIRNFIFAVNKMDLCGYRREVFEEIKGSLSRQLSASETDTLLFIPVSAKQGDNVTFRSANMVWYRGETLLDALENIKVRQETEGTGFLMPVQRVCRPNANFRGFMGQIACGTIKVGEEVTILPSQEKASVSRILVAGSDADEALPGNAATICLDREVDVSRGCMIVRDLAPIIGRDFRSQILWMDENRLVPGRSYIMQLSTQSCLVSVTKLEHGINVNTGEKEEVSEVAQNGLALVQIRSASEVAFLPFDQNKELGSFLLIDRISNATCACGVIRGEKKSSRHLYAQKSDIDRAAREALLGQKAHTLWFTGLSGSGKSAVGNALEKRLHAMGYHTMLLDGDNVRLGLNSDLEFSEADRAENIRRVAEVTKLLNDAGIIVITTFISPMRADRRHAREIIGDCFMEVYLNTPLSVCEARDVKGLYKKARAGEIEFFTGISSAYEEPEDAELVFDTSVSSMDDIVDQIIACSKERGFL